MSWDVELVDKDGATVEVDRHTEGSVYVLGGTTEADLCITYNYSKFYYEALNEKEGLRWLHCKKAEDTIEALQMAISKLGTEQDENSYWNSTPGNAGYALNILLQWANEHPEATWTVY